MSKFDHLTAALPIDDSAFNAYWEFYVKTVGFPDGGSIEIKKEKLRVAFKLAFLAGRDAALKELDLTSTLGAGVLYGGKN